ncbi:hypothetical protein Aglo01_66090 [Actinokineospora globicatena]|nr:hypothetical protein Aglo01_66090 [Actinokineospora globicatena]GLW88921.1 hypothetical protein Aglo02_65600 [Actinokineospora globicatena]
MGLLGPLYLCSVDRNTAPTAPKVRQLLALLMLRSDTMVRVTECVEELWGTESPKRAMSTLQTYTLQIRRAFTAAGCPAALLPRTQASAYLLAGHEVDWVRFERLAAAGRAAAAARDHRRAADLLTEALALWRGPAMVDVPTGPLSAARVVALTESRKVVLEQRVEAELRLGLHERLLPELADLTGANPTNENLHAQYMLALYRCGRPEDAEAVYRGLRDLLVDTLGVEPVPRLRALYETVLDRPADIPTGAITSLRHPADR